MLEGGRQIASATFASAITSTLNFTPTGSSVVLNIHAIQGGTRTVHVGQAQTGHYVYEAEPVVVTICNNDLYRYGFNGKLKDNEWAGLGNSLDFGARQFDSRIARFRSLDPHAKQYPFQSPYVSANNSPICGIDVEGRGFGYYLLYGIAQQTKSTVALSVSGGVQIGAAISAAVGMGVDPKGNVALFYSTSAGRDFNLNPSSATNFTVAGGAQVTGNLSLAPGRSVSDISGKSSNLSATFGANGLVATGGVSFNESGEGKDRKVVFNNVSVGVDVGTPGVSSGLVGNSTTAVLLSQGDYSQLKDRKWDNEGIKTAKEWQDASDETSKNKEGFWNYDGTEMKFNKMNSGKYQVVMIQTYQYNAAGTGKQGRYDVQTTRTTETGTMLQKVDNYT